MRKRGFSLAEVLVAASLAFLTLALLTRLLIPLLRSSQRSVRDLELAQLAGIASRLLIGDLQSAAPESLWLAQPQLFALQPLERVSDTGKRVFADHLVIYRFVAGSGELLRKECRPVDLAPDASASYSDNQLLSFQQLVGPRRTLLKGVLRRFELAPISPERRSILKLSMVLTDNDRDFQLEEVIALRNERP